MNVEQLIDDGEEALAEEKYERAQRIAQKIIDARHSYGFELMARAFRAQENFPRAIAVLQEGVAKAPRAWPLWMLLGEYCSDHGEYDKALLAYDTALGIEGVETDEVHLNAAIVHERAGRPEDALMRLHEVRGTDRDIAMEAARVRAEILLETERPDAAAAAAKAGLGRADHETSAELIAPLHAAMAKAAFLKNDRDAALRHAWEAIEHDADDTALWLIREIEGEYSDDAKYFRILVNGRVPADRFDALESQGFWRKFDVVADDEEEAMRFIARVEPPAFREALRADEVDITEAEPDQPKGVYWSSAHAFYKEGDE
ncbi:MAG TPA: tetratricopeptide repeat protein [Thermoanaerobaculia bacterium]|nr:tetratricopeptide repeat protein [Thermoanaerobaculia bacterium]